MDWFETNGDFPVSDWAELGRTLSTIRASGNVQVREDGEWFAELPELHCELCYASGSLLSS